MNGSVIFGKLQIGQQKVPGWQMLKEIVLIAVIFWLSAIYNLIAEPLGYAKLFICTVLWSIIVSENWSLNIIH